MKKLAQAIKNIWNYLRPSWEGDDSKFSYKRFAQYVFVSLLILMVVTNRINIQFGFYTFIVIAVLFALTSALITVPQLIRMLGEYKQIKQNEINSLNNTYTNNELPKEIDATSGNSEHISE